MRYQIKYGKDENIIDITETCLSKCMVQGIIFIPYDDNIRATVFGDPMYGYVKCIYVYDLELDESNQMYLCEWDKYVLIDTNNNSIHINTVPEYLKDIFPHYFAHDTLKKIQSKLQIHYGNFNEEIPEQLMAVRFLTGDEKVLEIGGNIGRNSLVIASILKEKGNNSLVVLESHPEIAKQLIENRDINGFDFSVEASALSKRNLIQYGWDTFESDEILEGFNRVNTIAWEDFQTKYNIEFDTLVLDCEGAFYHILVDMPEILTHIKKIFIENDFMEINQKKFVIVLFVI